MNKEEKEFQHPSFGMLGFSRVNGNSGYLFGTNVQPDNYIEMRLYTGRMKRDDIDVAMQHAVTKAGIKALGLQFNSDKSNIVTFKLLIASGGRIYACVR